MWRRLGKENNQDMSTVSIIAMHPNDFGSSNVSNRV